MLKKARQYDSLSGSRSEGSTVFTLTSDIQRVEVKQKLDQVFRPVFQRFVYGGEKIASHDLRRLLAEERYRSILPVDKTQELLDLVDFNPGKAISYHEFVKIVLGSSDAGSEFDDNGRLVARRILGSAAELEGKPVWEFICRNTMQTKALEEYFFRYRWLPPPFFMIAISIIEIVIYAYYTNNPVPPAPLGGTPLYNSPLGYRQDKRQEAWRFITYFLLHHGYVDLIFNLVIQIFFGFPLEVVFRFWRMMIVYFCGIIVGSLTQSTCDHYIGLVGAAGGSNAVLAAHFICLFYNWKHLNTNVIENREHPARRILCSVPLRMFVIVVLLGVQAGLALYRRFGHPDVLQIGITAHFGGIITGLLLGSAFFRDARTYPWQSNSGWLNLFTLMALLGGCVIFNIVYTGYPKTDYS